MPVANPRGLMVYDSAGHALEISTHAGLSAYASGQATPAEAHITFDNYSVFWGGYRVDERARQIIFHPLGACTLTSWSRICRAPTSSRATD